MIAIGLVILSILCFPAIVIMKFGKSLQMKLYKFCNAIGYNKNYKFGGILFTYLTLTVSVEFKIIEGSILVNLISLILLIFTIIYVFVYGLDSFIFIQKKDNAKESDRNE